MMRRNSRWFVLTLLALAACAPGVEDEAGAPLRFGVSFSEEAKKLSMGGFC